MRVRCWTQRREGGAALAAVRGSGVQTLGESRPSGPSVHHEAAPSCGDSHTLPESPRPLRPRSCRQQFWCTPSSSTPVHVLPRQACSGRGRTGCPARVPSGEQVLSYLPLRSQRLGRGPQGCQCGCELCPLGVTEPWKVDWGGAGTPINSTPLKSLPSLRLLGQGRATQLRRPSPARPWVVYSSQSQNLGL